MRGCSWLPTMSRCASSSGWSGSASSFPIRWTTSARKPSTPRSSQKRRTSCIASTTSGLAQFEVGLLRRGTGGGTTGRSPRPTSRPARRTPRRQLFGGPSPRPSRQTYQSRFGESRDDLDSRNHGCSELVWFGTQSSSTRSPRRWASASSRSNAREVAEDRVDRRVVAHVVAEVGHRRAVDRREPDRVDTEAGDVVEPRADAGEVADPVAVGVRERARIDLVDDGRPPPRRARRSACQSCLRVKCSSRDPS